MKGIMDLGKFYFISDNFFKKYDGLGLLRNKETIDGELHGRPCYYAFKDVSTDIYWMIPVSSKIEKYQREHKKAIDKYGICDGISFGYIFGDKKAFLVQNMFPVINKYINNIYIDKNKSTPVSIPLKLQSELNAKIRKALRLYRKGTKIILTMVLDIEKYLIAELEIEKAITEVAATKEI